jgi:hypothetical protein
MPEGHTIHRLAGDHNRDFSGQILTVSSPQGRFASGARTLNGRILQSVEAHGNICFTTGMAKRCMFIWDCTASFVATSLLLRNREAQCVCASSVNEKRLT